MKCFGKHIFLKTLLFTTFTVSILQLLIYQNEFIIGEPHDFRQSQTALTILWFDLKSFLDYSTPILGYPWTIPFEFPLFQGVVHIVRNLLNLPIESTARWVSYIFYIACLFPFKKIFQILHNENKPTFLIFSILYLSAPIYLNYSDAILIESTALFFSSYFTYLILWFRKEFKISVFIFTVLFGVLSALVKITTLYNFSIFIALYLLNDYLRFSNFKEISLTTLKKIVFYKNAEIIKLSTIYIGIFVCLFIWVDHSDNLKSLSVLGEETTSEALTSWNFGQKNILLSPITWLKLLSYVGIFNVILLLYFLSKILFLRTSKFPIDWQIFSLLLLSYIFPIITFSNLYITHNYYSLANSIFLLMFIAFCIDNVYKLHQPAFYIVLVFSVFSSYVQYYNTWYGKYLDIDSVESLHSSSLFLKKHTKEGSVILIADYEWNPRIAYYSERRSIALPDLNYFFKVVDSPNKYVGNRNISGIIITNQKDYFNQFLLNKKFRVSLCDFFDFETTIGSNRIYFNYE